MGKEESSSSYFVKAIKSVPLLVIALVFLLLTIALGAVGIVVATQSNICQGQTIGADCIPVDNDDLPADVNVTALASDLPLVVRNIRDSQHYLLWLTGATLCGLLFVLIGTLCVWISARIWWNGWKGEELKIVEEEQIDKVEDGIYEIVKEKDGVVSLKEPGIRSFIGIFLFFFFGILSIICMLWALGIAYNRSRRSENSVTPFLLANVLAGIIAPVFFFISIFSGLKFFDYYTDGKVKQHLILTRLLPCVKYEEGETGQYWVIADSLLLRCNNTDENDKSWSSLLPNSSTTLLCFIIALNMMVSFSFFIDISLVNQVSVNSCSDTNINIQYSCFKAGSLSPADCDSNNATQPLHCFRFYKFGVDVDLITSASSAFAFYLFASRSLDFIILLMKLSSVSKKKLKLQGAFFVVLFCLLFTMTVILSITWLTGVTSQSVSLLAHLDILNLAQLTMFSLFFLYVGLLAQDGEWVQKRLIRPTE